MSKVNFKYPLNAEAEDKLTGFKGTIIARAEYINGSIMYGIQPRMKEEDGHYIPDAKSIDEASIKTPDTVDETVKFKFKCGDKVKSIINDFEGVITKRTQWLNGCVKYRIEGKMIKSDLHGLTSLERNDWEQELELIKDKKGKAKKPVKVKGKKRTGGPSETFSYMDSV